MTDLNIAGDGLDECENPDYVEEFLDACLDLIDDYKDSLKPGVVIDNTLPSGAGVELELLSPLQAPTDHSQGVAEIKIYSAMEFILKIHFLETDEGHWYVHKCYFTGPNDEQDPSKCFDFWNTLDAFEIEWD